MVVPNAPSRHALHCAGGAPLKPRVQERDGLFDVGDLTWMSPLGESDIKVGPGDAARA